MKDGINTQKTERKRGDETLADNKKSKSGVLDKLNEAQAIAKIGSWEWNIQTGEVWWSDELYRIFELSPADYLPNVESTSNFVHPDDKEGYQEATFQCLETGEALDYELRIVTPAGKIKNCRSRASTDFDVNNNAVRMTGTVSDITLQVQVFNELIVAKERAEESDRLKSAFLANMSHEIRTQMNGILGFADLLKEPDLTEGERQTFIGIIEKSGMRMLNIINNLIDISKIEAGQMEITLTETNINEHIEFIYSYFNPEVEKKGMKFSYSNQLPSSKSVVRMDREKVCAILTNLVKNAIKYSKEGSIEFGYNVVQFLEFYVKDTGIGITRDRQVSLFERFGQAVITDKMAVQCTGLGLALSKAYAEMLGGKIWVESEPGKGSTFYFTIPYLPVNEI